MSRLGCVRKGKDTDRLADMARWEKKKGRWVVCDLERSGSVEKHC